MTTFGELIAKAKDEDKNKIRDVMRWTLEMKEKDTITKPLIKKVKESFKKLDYSNASNSNEMDSIGRWADKYQTFINNAATKKGGRRKRRKRSKKGGFMLLAYGAYKMYNHLSNKKGKKRRKKTRKRKKGGRKRKRTRKR